MELKYLMIVVIAFLTVFAMQVSAKSASASHILVKTESLALQLKDEIVNQGAEFASIAKKHSTCPSKAKGGSLGTFSPGQMVPTFDSAVFDANNKVGEVIGPVKTQFGYHLILITDRTD